jgi:hypothetical protein
MHYLYHIYVSPKAGVTQEQVEKKLNQAVDWYRYNQGSYVVFTTSDEDKWFARLAPLVKPEGYLFICKFDPSHRHGWMAESFWKWFQEKRDLLET